tara:strand:+ start:6445 stop:7017 length:573 start_codon:yes stop_codon:yes gene_type:complete
LSKHSKIGINWFKLNRTIHRDIGYFCISLTIVFAVSGLALNHVRDFNPNYQVERREAPVEVDFTLTDAQLNQQLLSAFDIDSGVKASYWESAKIYRVFLPEGHTITLSFSEQKAVYEAITPRPVLPEFNRLHLNEARQNWVVFSDVYALLLLYLALSALFMVKGKYGALGKKRWWLTLLGMAIPVFYIFF